MTAQTFSRKISRITHLTILLLMVVCLAPPYSRAQSKSPYSKERLLSAIRTNAQTRELSTKQLVEYIEQRGVDFEITAQDEVEFRNAGASSEVIAAIRNNHRLAPLPKGSGSMTINSTPADCKVFLNGQMRGVTGSDGVLMLRPLKAGQYQVTLKKEHYEEQQRSITVMAASEAMESFALTPLKGSLTVTPSLPESRVSVSGVDHPEGVKNLAFAPGTYEVRISKSGYKTVTQSVTISPGQPSSLSVTLEPMKVEEMITQGEDSLRQRNYGQAIAIARDILSSKPEEPKAHSLLGMSYFYSGNYDACVGSLVKAISLGEQVSLPVQRHNKYGMLGENDSLSPGVLIIGKDLLEFRASANASPVFSVSLDRVLRVLMENNRGGRIQVKIGNPGKKKDSGKDYNFHPIQAGLRAEVFGNTSRIAIYCGNCLPSVQAIYQILLQVKSASETSTPSKS